MAWARYFELSPCDRVVMNWSVAVLKVKCRCVETVASRCDFDDDYDSLGPHSSLFIVFLLSCYDALGTRNSSYL